MAGDRLLCVLSVLVGTLIAIVNAKAYLHPYDYMIGITHHKTGTSQQGCVMWNTVFHKGYPHPIYINKNVTHTSIAAHIESKKNPQSHHPAIVLTGDQLAPTCMRPPPGHGKCSAYHGACPCSPNGSTPNCLSLEPSCYYLIPAGHAGLVHIVRNPIDAIVSAYSYHMQVPSPEDWIDIMKVPTYSKWLQSVGVPRDELIKLGFIGGGRLDATAAGGIVAEVVAGGTNSYGEALRALPPEQGILLEFWRSAPTIYGMARMYAATKHGSPNSLVVRFEDLKTRFNSTVHHWVQDLGMADNIEEADVIVGKLQQCDPQTWNADQLASSSHVTATKTQGKEGPLIAALLGDGAVGPRICELAVALDYPDERCSGGGGGGGIST